MKHALVFLAAWALTTCLASAQTPEAKPAPTPPPQGRRFVIQVPPQYVVPTPPALQSLFPKDLPLRLGNGLCFVSNQSDSSTLFYGLTGSGDLAGPWVAQPGQATPLASRLFLTPERQPALVALRLDAQGVSFEGQWPLRDQQGRPLSGLPPKEQCGGGVVPLTVGLDRLPLNPAGILPGGVAKDDQHNCLWVSEGYGPSLLKVSPATGNILKRLTFTNSSLGELQGDSPSALFSGLCSADSGKLYASLEGPLRVAGKPAQFVRLLEYNQESDMVRHFAYPLDKNEYESLELVRVSDLCFVQENRFLVLEQGPGKKGDWLTRVFVCDIARATNIRRAVDAQDRPVETAGGNDEWNSLGLRMARKIQVLDLAAAGLKDERAVAMTLLPGRTSLAVLASSGWGIHSVIENPAKDSSGHALDAMGDYVLGPDKRLSALGRPTTARVALVPDPKAKPDALWLFTLTKDPGEYKITWQGGLPSPPVDGKTPPKPAPKEPPKSGH